MSDLAPPHVPLPGNVVGSGANCGWRVCADQANLALALRCWYEFRLSPEALHIANDRTGDLAGSRSACCDGDTTLPCEHLRGEVINRFDANGWAASKFLCDLPESVRVVASGIADDNREIRATRLRRDSLLP